MAPAAMMAPWPGIEARHGGHGADGAGIGERDGGALEIGRRQFAVAGARHQVVEGGRGIGRKLSAPAFLMLGTRRLRAPFLPATSTAMPKLISVRRCAEGLAGAFDAKAWFRPGFASTALHDGPSDEVRVGDLALAEQGAVVVDEAAIFVDHLDGDDALRGGQRDGGLAAMFSAMRAGAPRRGTNCSPAIA